MSIQNIFNAQIPMRIFFDYLQGICWIYKNQFKAIYEPV